MVLLERVFDRLAFDESAFATAGRRASVATSGLDAAAILREALANDRQRPWSRENYAISKGHRVDGVSIPNHRTAFRTPYDGRKLGPSLGSRGERQQQAQRSESPGPLETAEAVAGAAGRPIPRASGRAFVVERTLRDAPTIGAPARDFSSHRGPGSYNPKVRQVSSHVERAFAPWDRSMGRTERSTFGGGDEQLVSSEFELSSQPGASSNIGNSLAGGRFRVLSENKHAKSGACAGPLEASSSTSADVGPGKYNPAHSELKATWPHAPRAAILGRSLTQPPNSNLGPSTYDPFAPFGSQKPRETTPAGAGGLRYSFSSSAFYSKGSASRSSLPQETDALGGEDGALGLALGLAQFRPGVVSTGG